MGKVISQEQLEQKLLVLAGLMDRKEQIDLHY